MATALNIQAPVSLRQILRSTEAPLFDWSSIELVDTKGLSIPTGTVRQVVVMSDLRPAKIVLATDQGVFWSDVAADGHPYSFVPAIGIPMTTCLGLALGPNNSVVASPTGSTSSVYQNGIYQNGIYKGDWASGNLIMRRATHIGDIDFVQWNDAVVASSAGNRSFIYAAVSASGRATMSLREAIAKAGGFSGPLTIRDFAQTIAPGSPITLSALIEKIIPPQPADGVYVVVVSSDGGSTWSPCGPNAKVIESVQFRGDPGSTQKVVAGWAYNISLAVSPSDPNIVALGWRHGPWIGTNTGATFTWEEHGPEGSVSNPTGHIHSDTHGLHFDIHDLQGQTLYVCTDGGVAVTRDLCASFDSSINAELPNLQFQSFPPRGAGAGPSDVSLVTPGLVAGALQDNGVVFSFVGSDGTQRPWQRHSGDEDGQLAVFLTNNLLLSWTNTDPAAPHFNPRARAAKWTDDHLEPANFKSGVFVTVRTPSPTATKGEFLFNPFVEHVAHPAFVDPVTEQQMFAVAANRPQGPKEVWWGV
jgi:hypothetical protein